MAETQRGVEGWQLEDQTPCAGLRADLKICLLETDCCKKVSMLDLLFCVVHDLLLT